MAENKPILQTVWNIPCLGPAEVGKQLNDILENYADLIAGVAGCDFSNYNYKVAINPVDGKSPSILLTCLNNGQPVLMEPSSLPADCDIVVLPATSGIGKTRTIFQYLCKHFGLYITPTDIGTDEQSFQFGPRDFLFT